jgi:hypothetical protein
VETLAFELACNQVLPCASAASLQPCLHPHGLWSQLPCALAASLRRCLHSHEQRAIVVELPSLSDCHRCWAAIVFRLPSLLGCHHRQAAIVVRLPLLLGCHCCWAAIIAGLLLPPHSLGLPPNGLLLLGYIVALLGCLRMPCLSSLGCHCCPVPSCATDCLHTRLTPVAFSYATIAFCCPYV